jgi:drug/metabolite transporter (DMT)-like permease
VRGTYLGIILAAAFLTQTIGLSFNTAATTGFVTGLYVVVVPLLSWLMFRVPIAGRVWAGVALAFGGLSLISINDFGFNLTQLWTLVGAILFALHYVVLARWSPGLSSYALTLVQLSEATALAYFVQTWAEARMDASRVAVILTLEVVFAAIVAVAVGQEVLALKTVFGGALIVLATFVVEWPTRRPTVPRDV